MSTENLPKAINGATRDQLGALGFVFGNDVDALLVSCALPVGWVKRDTSSPWHWDLVDDKGRKRATMFHKADENQAEMTMLARYSFNLFDGSRSGVNKAVACDGEIVIHELGVWKRTDFAMQARLEKDCTDWLDKKYPSWRDPLAYWN